MENNLIYEVTERVVIHLGYSCNERCVFCYYIEDLKCGRVKDSTTEENKRKIRTAYKLGKREVDLSGGEPTIRKDLMEIISYCKKIGYRNVCIITNGLVTSKIDYVKSLKNSGLDEALFSIHSHDPKIHDSLTRVKGSFNKLIKSLENFISENIQIRINTVITNTNYKYINEFLELVSKYKPFTVNLIVFNPSETASNIPKEDTRIRFSDYHIIGEAISKALDEWEDKLNIINVRFLPFCFLPKHMDNIRTQWQKFHEDQEWDPILNIAFQKGWDKVIASGLVGSFIHLLGNVPKYKSKNMMTFFNRLVSAFRIRYYSYCQNQICKKECSLSPICTGIQKDYVKKFGFPKFNPIKLGEKVYDPLYFMKNYKSISKSLRK